LDFNKLHSIAQETLQFLLFKAGRVNKSNPSRVTLVSQNQLLQSFYNEGVLNLVTKKQPSSSFCLIVDEYVETSSGFSLVFFRQNAVFEGAVFGTVGRGGELRVDEIGV
jgi:hypothetical protein